MEMYWELLALELLEKLSSTILGTTTTIRIHRVCFIFFLFSIVILFFRVLKNHDG